MSFVSCIVMMSGCVLCGFLDFVSDAVYVNLLYDDVVSFSGLWFVSECVLFVW